MALTAGTRLGPYEITSAIGAGGMGEVYRARDTRLDRTVAIKVLPASLSADPSLRQRFEREARAISSLDHPHICGLFDVGTDDGRDYLVMQYLEGITLASRLERGPLPVGDALKIAAQIADALAAAHRRGIVHRDLKPGNVMLTPSGATLLDFGLAKSAVVGGAADMNQTIPALTAERTILGTLHYMAPEQVEGREADARSDIFALGAVLYEMVSGTRAFDGESPASVIAAVMSSTPKPLTQVAPLAPPALERIVSRCLAKDRDDRWQSASDLAFELRSSVETRGSTVAATAPARGRSLWMAAIALAAAVGVAAGALLFRQNQPVESREVRLTLLPPPDHEFAGTIANFDIDFAVSPNGSEIAYVTSDSADNRRLWIRSLAAAAPRLVPGADGAERPFWSPDSKAIAFQTDAGICRVVLASGAFQVLVPAANTDGEAKGSWGPGRIVFEGLGSLGGKAVRGIYSVPESGGAVVSVSAGQHPPSETGQRYPELLPDGQHFIYLSWAPEPQDRAIYLGSFDSEERTLLVRTGFRASFAAPDKLLYIRDRGLVAQRVDVRARRLVGEPQVLVEQLALEGIPGQAAFAGSAAGVLAYRTRGQEVESELRWIDRNGSVSQSLGAKAADVSVSLSPDQRLVAVTRLTPAPTEDRLPGNLWLFDLVRRVPTRLTLDGSRIDENPVWSPDGRRIVYASHRLSALAEVRLQNASEPGQGTLLFNPSENFHPVDWSRDGKYVLLQGYGAGTDDVDLWIVEPREGAQPRPIVTQPRLQAQGQFSPNGKWLAYTSNESGRSEIYVRPFPTAQARTQVSASGGAQPRWRGDSRELFYVAPDGTMMAVPVGIEGTLGTPLTLFKEPSLRVNNYVFFYGGAAGYAVAHDGSRFLVNRLTREPATGPIQLVIDAAALR